MSALEHEGSEQSATSIDTAQQLSSELEAIHTVAEVADDSSESAPLMPEREAVEHGHWSEPFPDWMEKMRDPEMGFYPAKVAELKRIFALLDHASDDELRIGFGTIGLPPDVIATIPGDEREAFCHLDDLELQLPLGSKKRMEEGSWESGVMARLTERLPDTFTLIRADMKRLGIEEWGLEPVAIRANHTYMVKPPGGNPGWHLDNLNSEYDPRTVRYLMTDNLPTMSRVGEAHVDLGDHMARIYDEFTGAPIPETVRPMHYKPGTGLSNHLMVNPGTAVVGTAGDNFDIMRFGLADEHVAPFLEGAGADTPQQEITRTFVFLQAVPPRPA